MGMSTLPVLRKTSRTMKALLAAALAVLLALALALAAQVAGPKPAVAAIVERGDTWATTGGTTLTIGKPAGVVAGDVMIVNIAKVGNNTTAPSLNGWTLIDGRSLNGGTLRYGAVLYKVAGSSEPASYAFALGFGTYGAVGSILAFYNVDTSGATPFDVAPGAILVSPISQIQVAATTITTVSSNAALIMFGMAANSGPTWNDGAWSTASAGPLSELYDRQLGTASVGAAWVTMAVAGATGNGSATLSAAQRNGAILIALKPLTPTTLTVSAVTGSYGGNASLTATLSPAMAGKTISFTLDGTAAGTAVTDNSGIANIPSASLAGINPGSYPSGVGASFAGDAGCEASSGTASLTVNKATPVITWANPADIVYGTALSSAQLCASASVPGTFVYNPSPGTMLSAGSNQTLHVDFTPADAANYNAASKNVAINVNKATPTITWANPAGIVYGTALSTTQLCATASVPGTFVYTPDCEVILPAGDGQTLHVAFTPSDAANYSSVSRDVTISVSKASLTITADNLNKAYGETSTLAGTEFTATGLLNGDTVPSVTLTSAGIAADAPVGSSPYSIVPSGAAGTGLDNYNITYVKGYLTVSPASVSLSLTTSRGKATLGHSVTFTASVTGPLATGTITFMDSETVLEIAALSDGTATYSTEMLPVGNHSITAVYSGDANFTGITSSPVDLTVKKAGGFNWALIGWIIAGAAVGLFFLIVIYRRRRKHASRTSAIGRAMGVVFNDEVTPGVALSTVEEVSTYPIQIEWELESSMKRVESSMKRVEKSMEGAIQAILSTVETKDPYVCIHQKRVAQFACDIAREMGLTASQIEGIRMAGLLHDIGKVTVPTEILTKPGRLSKIELSMIRDHPKVAYDILKNVEFDRPIAKMVVQHHERLDGSGYPNGISGEDILLEARILAVADVVEAMCTDRPYRPALGVKEALDELDRGDGKLYDSDVVRACKKLLNERGFKFELAASRV
jgi:putative nucleotidyltransferase with HDIG domain